MSSLDDYLDTVCSICLKEYDNKQQADKCYNLCIRAEAEMRSSG